MARASFLPHGPIYIFLALIILTLTTLTVVYAILYRNQQTTVHIYPVHNGIIGSPIRLPNDGQYVQFTFLHLNDVYELLPLDRGQKGGLARVAYIRKLLEEENPHTYTILAGDLVSPSALGLSRVNGTTLAGRQMVATMNTLGLDYMVLGNHEFDLSKEELLLRMNESKFTWLNSNVFESDSEQYFGRTIPHRILTIDSIRILLIGLTIDSNQPYVRIIKESALVNYTQNFLKQFPNGTYDVLIAITHLEMSTDIQLASKLPQIDLIMGGHEHENNYYLRGTEYIPICKADANAFTVFIHRCAFNINTKRFRHYGALTRITAEVPNDEKTNEVSNYWFNLGMQGFEALGYQANKTVACLPDGIELDGRSESVRSTRTLLTDLICESFLYLTQKQQTTIAILNGGGIRIDDILRGTVTQYDILRTMPFGNIIVVLSVPGNILAQVLSNGLALKNTGMFLVYTGIETLDDGMTWRVNGTNISNSTMNYTVATVSFLLNSTLLGDRSVTTLYDTNITQTKSFVDYLGIRYPCS